MKKITYITRIVILALAFVGLLNTSCRKDLPVINNPNDYLEQLPEIFESFWHGMNNNYVFWDIDPTDWDGVYHKYKPLFADLDIDDPEDLQTALNYFVEMTENLVDGHFAVQFSHPLLANVQIVPGYIKRRARPDYQERIPDDYFSEVLAPSHLDADFDTVSTEAGDGSPVHLVSGTINNEILYFRVNSFSIGEVYTSDEASRELLNTFFAKIHAPEIKGIVIDLRGNGGGNASDLNFLMGRFVDRPTEIAELKTKSSNNRLDYTPWSSFKVFPQAGSALVTKPVVALADMHSLSMAEITTMAVKKLPNGHFVGERTGGGQGPLTQNQVYNAGQFSTKFFSLVYTSSQASRFEGKSYEGVGLTPDRAVTALRADLAQGNDAQLEEAINVINGQ